MKREPSMRECLKNDCQLVHQCTTFEVYKSLLVEFTKDCYAYLPPVPEMPGFTKFGHKKRFTDEDDP